MKLNRKAGVGLALMGCLVLIPWLTHADQGREIKPQWKGTGNVVFTRCVGMERGPNCLTHLERKQAAVRLKRREGLPAAPVTKQKQLMYGSVTLGAQ